MNLWNHIGYAPLLVLLVIAAAACLILAAELYPQGAREIVKAAPPERRLRYALGGLALLLGANVVMFLIAAFIGFGLGVLYLLVAVATVMLIAVPALAIPPFNQVIERLSVWQLVRQAGAVIVVSLVLAVIYVVIANKAGLPLLFGT